MKKEERFFWNLAIVAWSDGELTDAESRILHNYAELLGVSSDRVDELSDMARLDAAPEKMARPETDAERRSMLRTVVDVAVADGRLGDREEALISRFFDVLGADPGELETLLERARNQVDSIAETRGWTDEETFRLLIAAAFVDGDIAEEEKKLVLGYAASTGISQLRAEEIFKELQQAGRLRLNLPDDEEDLMEVLARVSEIVAADGKLSKGEKKLLKKLKKKSGLSDDDFAQFIPVDLLLE